MKLLLEGLQVIKKTTVKNIDWNTYFSALIVLFILLTIPLTAQNRFEENFEGDLSQWILVGENYIKIIDSKDTIHNHVMELKPNDAVYALIKNSDKWSGIQITGEVFFPDDRHNYLGLIYNYQKDGFRYDFGSIYIKGNGSYIRVNPHRDGNVSRLMYEELKMPLTGHQKIIIQEWHRLKAEIIGPVCHFYVEDMSKPKVTFDLYEHARGLVGFKPRVVGYPVWIDNIKVVSIKQFSYKGPNIPYIVYEPDAMITSWDFIGPLHNPINEIESSSEPSKSRVLTKTKIYNWKTFSTDGRGAVITGRITEFKGDRPVAYFRTILKSETEKNVILHFSTLDELGLWINGIFQGYIHRNGYGPPGSSDWYMWYDFWKNPKHSGRKIPVALKPGRNQIIIRTRNGPYASGGFFVRLEDSNKN
jgi:hypothetical protein